MIEQWNYYYCDDCRKIRYLSEVERSAAGMSCRVCGSSNLESPGWVSCPHHKYAAVVCPRAGKGLTVSNGGYVCEDICSFRRL